MSSTYSSIQAWKSPLFLHIVELTGNYHLALASLRNFPTLEQRLKERKDQNFRVEKFGREIFCEAMRSYFWDCWDESLFAKPSSVGYNASELNFVRFSSPAIASSHLERKFDSHMPRTIPCAQSVINKFIILIIDVDGHSFGTTS